VQLAGSSIHYRICNHKQLIHGGLKLPGSYIVDSVGLVNTIASVLNTHTISSTRSTGKAAGSLIDLFFTLSVQILKLKHYISLHLKRIADILIYTGVIGSWN